MTTMISMLVILTLLNLGATGLVYALLSRLNRTVDAALAVAQRPPPDVGGRPIPTPAELAAARNRVDAQGTAHPGKP